MPRTLLIVLISVVCRLCSRRQRRCATRWWSRADRRRPADRTCVLSASSTRSHRPLHSGRNSSGSSPVAPLLIGIILALLVAFMRPTTRRRERSHVGRRRPSFTDGALRPLSPAAAGGPPDRLSSKRTSSRTTTPQVGAAVRAIHAGCRSALHQRMRIRARIYRAGGRQQRSRSSGRLRRRRRCASPATYTASPPFHGVAAARRLARLRGCAAARAAASIPPCWPRPR